MTNANTNPIHSAGRLALAACVTVGVAFAAPVVGQTPAPSRASVVNAPRELPSYRPPTRGAPTGRIGGGTRGPSGPVPQVSVLAPEDVGLASTDRPRLHWYVDRPTSDIAIEITLLTRDADEPAVVAAVKAEVVAGIHVFDLADQNFRMVQGEEYEWSVSIVVDPENRSKDNFTRGLIRFEPLSSAARQRIADSPSANHAAIYANEGYWYDAFATACAAVRTDPGDEFARQIVTALLEQVNLQAIAKSGNDCG